MKKLILLASAFLVACASTPLPPPEPPITVTLDGSSTEVQNFIEEKMRVKSNGAFRLESANDRRMVMKGRCNEIPGISSMKCALVMMTIGNSRWDGPDLHLSFNTPEIRGQVKLSLRTEWCATNPFGKTNCSDAAENSENNKILRSIESSFASR